MKNKSNSTTFQTNQENTNNSINKQSGIDYGGGAQLHPTSDVVSFNFSNRVNRMR